ncbi:glycoside hydrolase family 18 protein [Pleomassaria siparia CBS 279.74]|uniref:chitinase n=1 Tax=Pleomassaria siparia CBS 279.74 TaxID=1314801 RepID=A0A6G1KLL8_9PLEO|nr:glycoside hydrolase family 18 protein [Pleomassaria siparia CBS 279.74]
MKLLGVPLALLVFFVAPILGHFNYSKDAALSNPLPNTDFSDGNLPHLLTKRASTSCDKSAGSASKGRHVAYYQVADAQRRHCDKMTPNQLKIEGLTHLNLAFATFDPATFQLRPENPSDLNVYAEFTALKSKKLQTWISVGGWAFSEPGVTRKAWSNMAEKPETRAKFINSAKAFMRQHGFQGLDLRWEFPGAWDRGGRSGDRANHLLLVKELKKAFGNDYGLSVAVPATKDYLQHFDTANLQSQVDWFNIMTYDLHGVWEGEYGVRTLTFSEYAIADPQQPQGIVRPHTDLRDTEVALQSLLSTVDASKVNLGLAYYARGYTLSDTNCRAMGCNFKAPSNQGACSEFEGYLMNSEVEAIIEQKSLTPKLIKEAAVKLITWEDQWVAYDDDETYAIRQEFANSHCLGGTFIWSLDYGSRRDG